jgi:hypothetical protein
VAVGVAVRLLAFAGLVYLAARLRRGRNWARVALAVLYGGIGTLSPAIGPVTWLANGGSLSDAVAAADLGSVLFAASRVVHLGAVIAALILMFTRPPTPTSKQPYGLPAQDAAGQERRRSQMIDVAEHPASTSGGVRPGCWSGSRRSSSTRSASTPSDVPIPVRATNELAWTQGATRHGDLLLRG